MINPEHVHQIEHLWHLWPEVLGGFIAFCTHELRHKLFHVIVRHLPHLLLRGGR